MRKDGIYMAMHTKTLLSIILIGGLLMTGACQKSQAASGQAQEKPAQEKPIQEKAVQEENTQEKSTQEAPAQEEASQDVSVEEETAQDVSVQEESTKDRSEQEELAQEKPKKEKISFDSSWDYASYSRIHSGKCYLYHADQSVARGVTVCVNAGHGTEGGSSVKTQCHPDGSAKLVSGSTSAGQTMAAAIAEGMTFPDGTKEDEATLSLAKLVRDRLLDAGYDVLMIREKEDVQLDNIARTLIANNYADCHIALHYDSTESDKGAFYMSVPNVSSYRKMEPVRSCWKQHHKLGNAVIKGLKKKSVSIFGDGTMAMDLTQTSYSTIPSIDLEVGDAGSDISESTQKKIAAGILKGLNLYFKDSDKASGR